MIYTVTLNPAIDRELTVPDFAYDTVLRASAWRVDWGGKGFNVSRMLRALGEESVALGFAGGHAGQMLREGLQELGIATEFIPISGETRTNVSIVGEQRDHYLKVNEPGPPITAADLDALRSRIAERAQPGDWWVMAGSLPPGAPPDSYAELVTLIQENGARAILDSSGEALARGCSAGPFLIKPNDTELQRLSDRPVKTMRQAVRAARTVLRRGVRHVVVSMGRRGALLIDEEGAWQAAAPSIAERNPIGAGDSLVGGLVWALSQGRPPAQALRWGVACGTATAGRDGTAVGSRQQVEQLAAQVSLQALGEPQPATGDT
ncbi:MAG: 1-phosphofructokinase [bacterium]